MAEKPILVTGSTRSGTTWVGRLISTASFVRYIHEPCNMKDQQCACGLKGDQWFPFISPENEQVWKEHLAHHIEYPINRMNLLNLAEVIRSPRNIKGKLRIAEDFFTSLFTNKALVKDPLALFSAEWLASRFNMDVLVLIRHPAGFVSSYKMLNWSHPFSDFLDQPLLLRNHLSPFKDEIRDYVSHEHDIIDQAALLWRLIYFMVINYRKTHPDWVFVRYEDLCRDPGAGFRHIFNRFNLKFSNRVRRFMEKTTIQQDETGSKNPYSVIRNSATNIWKWRNNLSPEEIKRVRKAVADVACHFYLDEDWETPEGFSSPVLN